MSALVTCPGRTGDLLWSLPTARLIAERGGSPVDFMTSKKYGDSSLLAVLKAQPYINHAYYDDGWEVLESAPISPRVPPGYDEAAYHLGYSGWPLKPLPFWAAESAGFALPPEVLDRPWITLGQQQRAKTVVAVGFTPEWIELKMGSLLSVAEALPDLQFKVLSPPWPSRHEEWNRTLLRSPNVCLAPCDWEGATRWMEGAACYFGCLSALWVLANATGTKAVVLEPHQDRLNPVFFLDRPRNRFVLGGDRRPTHDARHAADTLREVLK